MLGRRTAGVIKVIPALQRVTGDVAGLSDVEQYRIETDKNATF